MQIIDKINNIGIWYYRTEKKSIKYSIANDLVIFLYFNMQYIQNSQYRQVEGLILIAFGEYSPR